MDKKKNIQEFINKPKYLKDKFEYAKKCLIQINLKKLFFFLIMIVLLLYNKYYIKINTKICLCVIAKNENLYVREFVEHYKKIGYNNIFLYDNNDKNGENFEEVIDDYIKSGFVKIIDYRERNNKTKPIFDAYKDCYSKNKNLYNWLSFYDMDEFLEINQKYKNIQDFLNDGIFKHCYNIKINWLIYKNQNSLYFENKPLQQRIKTYDFKDSKNKHIKSTIRGNLAVNYWNDIPNPHSSNLNITTCSSSGKLIEYNSPFNFPPDYTNAKLKHYYYKSFEEYCIKINRGKCDYSKFNSNQLAKIYFKRLYNANKNDTKKLLIMKSIFKDSIYNIT